MHRFRPALALVFAVGCVRGDIRSDLLLHWCFDEGRGAITKDSSGNGLDGSFNAPWVDSPSGKALQLDGTPATVVTVQVPEDLRFGKESWTFTAMVRPRQFAIADRQNQRRLFAFGVFPEAYLVIDIGGTGALMCYFCYKDAAGKTISTGGSSGMLLAKDMWAHVALVCDRAGNEIRMYVNGYSSGPARIRQGFAGDYTLGGQLTVGSSWHNYWGLVDEVKVFRRALSEADIGAEFARLKETFSVVEPPEAVAARKRDALMAKFADVSRAWERGDFTSVRQACQAIVESSEVPANVRSYAHLRIAQSYRTEKNPVAAQAAYRGIADTDAYPEVHRAEARECITEISRTRQGLPPRDPAASRTEIPALDEFAAEVYVAPDGDDVGDGSPERPFATLTRARDAVRKINMRGIDGPVAVRILPGEYPIRETLVLTAEDSGTARAPVVYRAEEKGAAVFYGGARLSGFVPVSDGAVLSRLPVEARGHVRQCDLKALGIREYGELKVRGFGQPPSPPTLELYLNGVPMTLARWPNEGFVGIERLVEAGSKAAGKPSVFEYDSDRHERWLQARDGWLFGYFHFLWADATAKIGSIDPETRTLTTAEPYHYGGRGMSTRQGIQYYAFNLLEEIDRPGEWYLDRETGILYLYPPSDPAAATVEIGMFAAPIVTMDNVSHVRLEGLVFDLARYNGIVITNSDHCLVAGCTVRRMAGNGITIRGGQANGILGCDVHTIGRRATEVIGGDRETLTPGRHFVENCRIHFFGRIDRTYTPAIQLEGVGNRVAHNLMYNCPSSAMRIEGNDHLIEYNEVHSAVRESDDQGAMELFRNATYRGVVFRHNYIHQVGKTGAGTTVHGQAGIRFDDAISGMLVYGNIFWQSANGHFGAIQMNSGRDNIMDNNIFVDCKQGLSGGWNPGNNVWKMLREGKDLPGFFRNDLYLSRYPRIATMLDAPGINHVWRNVFYRCGTVATRRGNLDLFRNGVFEETDPGFVDAARGDFRLRPGALLFARLGFRPVPVDEIGLYRDRYRASWPVRTRPVAMPDWRKGE